MRTSALMYHDVEDVDGPRSGFDSPGADVYKVTTDTFLEHLDAIEHATGRPPVRATDRDAGDGAWMLTFDDGGASSLTVGEELARRSWPAHFFITTDLVGTPGFVSWDDVRALARLGHVVGSHSRSHPPRMMELEPAGMLDEWTASAGVLADALGERVQTASVPGGFHSHQVATTAAAAGFSVLFTSLPTRRVRELPGCLVIGRYAIRRGTPGRAAAAAAAGHRSTWARQAAPWTLRQAAKRLAGPRYEQVRRALLARRS